jgi:hypothetical protein
MIGRRKTGMVRVGIAAMGFCAVAALAAGCPGFEVADVHLASSSAQAASFTLAATVIVTEEDPALDDNGDLEGGRGLLGIWLPPGWAATAARVKAPSDASFVPLVAVPDGDGHFPAPFPWVPGAWTAFASPCGNVAEGTFEYAVEVDVSGPAGATDVVLGVSTALFDEAGSNGAAPSEIAVDLFAASLTVRAAPAAPAPAGLEQCAAIPYGDEPSSGGDSCACAAPGARTESAIPLLVALF